MAEAERPAATALTVPTSASIAAAEAASSAGTVVIAIVSYGRPEDVTACLSALARSTFGDFEIVVVENAGAAAFDRLCAALEAGRAAIDEPGDACLADPARAGARCKRWQRYRLDGHQLVLAIETSDNLGYAGGVNVAIRCLGDGPGWRGLWVLNPDTKPEPAALQKVVEHTERGGYGMVGCRLVLTGSNRIQMRGARWRRLIGRGWSIGRDEPADLPADTATIERQLEWVSGAALYATRRFVETVGPMDERFFLYCEDTDWSLRRGSFRLGYAHDAVVHHASGTTLGSSSQIRVRSDLSVYLAARNALLLTRLRWPALYPLVVLTTLALLPDCLVRGDWRVFRAACRGWWAGIRGEVGRPTQISLASAKPLMSEPAARFVSVVIPHFNDLDNLALVLDALKAQSWSAKAFEVIVSDNNSPGGIAAVQAIAPDARVVHAVGQGAGPARNAGAAVARGDVFAFLDSDCIADAGWLQAGMAALDGYDYVGGQVIITVSDPARLSPTEAYEAVFAYNFRKYIEQDRYSGTGNLFVPRAVFDRVGGFRSGVAEDMEWCWRANALGYRLGYAEKAVVHTPARRTWSELKRKHDRMEREHLLLYRERPGWRIRWLCHAALVALSPLGHWVRVLRSDQLIGIRARLNAILGLLMIRLYRCYRMMALLLSDRPDRSAAAAR